MNSITEILEKTDREKAIETAKKYAAELKQKGYHCSESVIRAVPKALGIKVSDDVIKAACAFFGGGGGTGGRCGVIESGIILVSMLFGRSDNSISEFDAKVVAAELIRRYKAQMGTDACVTVKAGEVAKFGAEYGCQRIYEEGSALVTKLILDGPRLIRETDPEGFAIKQTEDGLTGIFSRLTAVTENLYRYIDDSLPDMYDLNCFEFDAVPGHEEIQAAIDMQRERGDKFLKIESRKRLSKETAERFGLEEWQDLVMVLKNGDPSLWTKNTKVEIRNLHEDDINDDLIDLEMRNYGKVYGEDFTKRKILHWTKKAKESKALNFYGAYIDGEIAGSLYTFKGKDYLSIDGLIVDPKFRMQYVATTLLAAAIEKEGGIPFLHAEADDTPKDMYKKLGFESELGDGSLVHKWNYFTKLD